MASHPLDTDSLNAARFRRLVVSLGLEYLRRHAARFALFARQRAGW